MVIFKLLKNEKIKKKKKKKKKKFLKNINKKKYNI